MEDWETAKYVFGNWYVETQGQRHKLLQTCVSTHLGVSLTAEAAETS